MQKLEIKPAWFDHDKHSTPGAEGVIASHIYYALLSAVIGIANLKERG